MPSQCKWCRYCMKRSGKMVTGDSESPRWSGPILEWSRKAQSKVIGAQTCKILTALHSPPLAPAPSPCYLKLLVTLLWWLYAPFLASTFSKKKISYFIFPQHGHDLVTLPKFQYGSELKLCHCDRLWQFSDILWQMHQICASAWFAGFLPVCSMHSKYFNMTGLNARYLCLLVWKSTLIESVVVEW